MGDVVDQAIRVVEGMEMRQRLARTTYFAELATQLMHAKRPRERWRCSMSFCVKVSNPDRGDDFFMLWIVTMLNSVTLRVINVIYRECAPGDCGFGDCQGHLIRIVEHELPGNGQ